MGLFGFGRIQRAVWGDEFATKALNPLQLAIQRTENAKSKLFQETNDVIADAFGHGRIRRVFGIDSETREQITRALELTDANGNFTGPRASMPDEVIKAASGLRTRVFNQAFKDYGLDPDIYINQYAPHRRATPNGAFWGKTTPQLEALRNHLDPAGIRFTAELERKGVHAEWDMDVMNLVKHYVDAGARAKILVPVIENIERESVNPYFDRQIIRSAIDNKYITLVNDRGAYEAWRDLRDHVLGVPTNIDRQLTSTMRRGLEMVGINGAQPGHLYQASQLFTNMYYGGVLGVPGLGTRPASLLRHMFRLSNVYSEFGAGDTLAGISKAFEPGAWASYTKRGIITPPLESLNQQIELGGGVGRTLAGVASGASRGVSATTRSGLWLFDGSDRYMRMMAAGAADARFDRALAEDFVHGLRGGEREGMEHIVSLARRGQVERARDEYAMHIVANTMYAYGKGNRPQMFRGTLGNALGILSSYPLNLSEMYIRLGKRAYRGITEDKSFADAMPLVRQMGLVAAGMYAGSEFLNSDMSSVFLHGALPESLAGPAFAMHAYEAGRSNVMWGVGNVFLTGETDFHKHQRAQNNREFMRDFSNLVPGGLFMKEVGDYLDEPSFNNLVKHMGLPPLAEEANQAAKARMRARGVERRLENVPKVKGLEE
jgi:hypothetical protein